VIDHLLYGFTVAFEPINLVFLFTGAFLGTFIGMLPGIGPTGTIALLLPITFGMRPTAAIILLAAVYYGACYGGSTTSILLNIPGESSSVVTTIDGNQMARHGRGGPALAIAAIGSFIAGNGAIVFLMLFAPIITEWALKFGPAEYFTLMVFGLSTVASLSGGSQVKSLISLVLGLMIATVGLDQVTGHMRFTGGSLWLADGIGFQVVAIGMFAVSEVLITARAMQVGTYVPTPVKQVWLKFKDFKESTGAILRGSVLGFFIGVLPGAGTTIASFLSYNLEKRVARNPERFGKGDIRGVAAPESANNAASGGSMVPLLTLGIPGSAATAMMLAALMMVGIVPGPTMIQDHPDVFWGLIASMYMGNLMLLIINFPLIPLLVKILIIPARILLPLVLTVAAIGVYAGKYSPVDLALMGIFGGLGYYMRNRDYPLAPIVLGLVLGGRMEQSLRRSLIISDGSPIIFFQHPISAIFLTLSILSLIAPSLIYIVKRFFRYKIALSI
jgi:putative tricarboxylic transport membrane protein